MSGSSSWEKGQESWSPKPVKVCLHRRPLPSSRLTTERAGRVPVAVVTATVRVPARRNPFKSFWAAVATVCKHSKRKSHPVVNVSFDSYFSQRETEMFTSFHYQPRHQIEKKLLRGISVMRALRQKVPDETPATTSPTSWRLLKRNNWRSTNKQPSWSESCASWWNPALSVQVLAATATRAKNSSCSNGLRWWTRRTPSSAAKCNLTFCKFCVCLSVIRLVSVWNDRQRDHSSLRFDGIAFNRL